MQKGSFTETTPRYDTAGVCRRINALSEYFRSQSVPVIFIQHDGSRDDEFHPGSEAWQLLNALEVLPTDLRIEKTANDCFYRSNLDDELKKLDIIDLYITGCATDFCVASTVQSALSKDYNVMVVEDGHTTGDRPELNAKQVIDHYNWVWKNMIPTLGRIDVAPTSDIATQSLNPN